MRAIASAFLALHSWIRLVRGREDLEDAEFELEEVTAEAAEAADELENLESQLRKVVAEYRRRTMGVLARSEVVGSLQR
jgi:cell division protein FtsB